MWLGPRQAPVFTGGVLEGSSSSFGSKYSGASRRRQACNVRANRAAGMVTRVNRLYYAVMLGLKSGEIRIDLGSSVLLTLVASEGPRAAETTPSKLVASSITTLLPFPFPIAAIPTCPNSTSSYMTTQFVAGLLDQRYSWYRELLCFLLRLRLSSKSQSCMNPSSKALMFS
jgi:hypothetical protein